MPGTGARLLPRIGLTLGAYLSMRHPAKSAGFDDRTRRVVSENWTALGAKSHGFE